MHLTAAEQARYSRHLLLAEVGAEGQAKLKSARVLLVGAGGLGAPAALYLAAAGVGTLGLVDDDRVDETNLQRQVLFTTADVGGDKLAAAAARLHGLNPHVTVVQHRQRFRADNAATLVADYDLVLDCTDNFPTRYLINDACVLGGKPNVFGSIHRFEGQLSVFAAVDGPCYRCLHPAPPPAGAVPSCAEAGVLGVLPGIVGTLQALEAIKLILGVGQPLIGRLALYDALAAAWRELRLHRDPGCPVCGATPSITAVREAAAGHGDDADITAAELQRRLAGPVPPLLLDVREPAEHQRCHLGGQLIPLAELAARLDELDRQREIVVYCKLGGRSAQAVALLRRAGFARVRNLAGGIDGWARDIDPTMPRY